MKKLEAYKQAKADRTFALETAKELKAKIDAIDTIEVSSSIIIKRDSSEKQMIYAVGILNAQIQASKELGVDSTEIESNKAKLIELRSINKQYNDWDVYADQLYRHMREVHSLLDNDELFELLEAPVKP